MPTPRPRTRKLAAALLVLALVPGTWTREIVNSVERTGSVGLAALPMPAAAAGLGPFRLRGIWHLFSEDGRFGGYSALVARPGGRLLAISDRGQMFDFNEPPQGPAPYRLRHTMPRRADWSRFSDAEAATAAPSGDIWITWEDRRLITWLSADLARTRTVMPRAIRGWSGQFGAEAFARLPDGRFILVSEGFVPRSYERLHQTLLFPSDPVAGPTVHPRLDAFPTATMQPASGRLRGTPGYRPTDMALLPDGRMLVLERRLTWPLPLRFSCRIGIADPAELIRTGMWTVRPLASLDAPMPPENYEGMAVRPRADGKVDVWVIADDNKANSQRTLLLRLELDPRALPAR